MAEVNETISISFEIEFHGPFRVATGYARDGLDAAADHSDPVPATALKGLARHHSSHVLGLPIDLVEATFGSASQPCPWRWSDASFRSVVGSRRSQTAIDADSGRPVDGSLRIAEELWCEPGVSGAFTITNEVRIAGSDLVDQLSTLIASTCSIHSLGSDRRRGLGWCTVTLLRTAGVPSELSPDGDWAPAAATHCVERASGARNDSAPSNSGSQAP